MHSGEGGKRGKIHPRIRGITARLKTSLKTRGGKKTYCRFETVLAPLVKTAAVCEAGLGEMTDEPGRQLKLNL